MIDFLVRAHNETTWLPLLFKSLEKQEQINISNVLLLDNNSKDNPDNIKGLFPNLNIIYKKFEQKYYPGKMLNYGIEILKKYSNEEDFLCILSAHCFFQDTKSLNKLFEYLLSIENCRAAFGRQVPMTISSPQAIRDLVLLYPKESRLITKAPAFNNAYSLISYKALKNNLFDEDTTNLEDVIWASKELKRGFKIAYCASSEIVHYHGPHQENTDKRLLKTELTIKNNSDIFNVSLKEADVNKNEFMPLFVGNLLEKALLEILIETSKNQKVVLWTNIFDDSSFNKKQRENILWIKREEEEGEEKSLYEILPNLYCKLIKLNLVSPFYLLYDNSFDDRYSFITNEIAAEYLSKNYGDIVWPAVLSKKLIFSLNQNLDWVSNQVFNSEKFEKNKAIEVIRGNGTILSLSSILDPRKMFNNPKFIFLD